MPEVNLKLTEQLAAKKAAILKVLPCVLNEKGIGRLVLKKKNHKPVDAEFFAGLRRDEAMPASPIRDVLNVPPEDFWNYENPGMIAHRYLGYLRQRGARGYNEELVKQAEKIREGLFFVQKLGRKIAPGFLTKPYGMKESPETSLDEIFAHAVSIFLLGQIFPHTRKELGKRAAETCDWMMDNNLEYECPSGGGKKQRLIGWAPGSCTAFYKISVMLSLAAGWAERRDIEHLLHAVILRQKGLLKQDADNPAWHRVLETMPENMYHWPYGAWVQHELGFFHGEIEWLKAIQSMGVFLRQTIETGESSLRPTTAMGWFCSVLLCEEYFPGTVDAGTMARLLNRWELDDMHMGYGMGGGNWPEICNEMLSVKCILQWLEAYWRGVRLGLWHEPER